MFVYIQTFANSFLLDDLVDFEFSPFHDDVLGALYGVNGLRLFRCPFAPTMKNKKWLVEHNANEEIVDFELSNSDTLPRFFNFHPTVDSLVVVGHADRLKLYDICGDKFAEPLQSSPMVKLADINSISFEHEGRLIAVNGRTASGVGIEVHDLRLPAGTSGGAAHTISVPSGQLCSGQSRVLYLDGPHLPGNAQLLSIDPIPYGHNFTLYDVRAADTPLKVFALEADRHTKAPESRLAFYDYDTGLIFTTVRQANWIEHFEAVQLGRELYNSYEKQRTSIARKIVGAALAPKRMLDAMSCEIDCVVTLHRDSCKANIYTVPRKSATVFHEDVYQPTKSPHFALTDVEQLKGDKLLETISLNPANNSKRFRHGRQYYHFEKVPEAVEPELPKDEDLGEAINVNKPSLPPKPSLAPKVTYNQKFGAGPKFKYLVGKLAGREEHFTDLSSLSVKIPQTMDFFHVDRNYAIFPVGSNVNELACLPLAQPGKVDMANVVRIRPCAPITCFGLHPNSSETRLGVACGKKIYIIDLPKCLPEGTVLTDFDRVVEAKSSVSTFAFHPKVDGMLVVCSSGGGGAPLSFYNYQQPSSEGVEVGPWPSADMCVLAMDINPVEPGGEKIALLNSDGELWLVNRSKEITSLGRLPGIVDGQQVKNGRVRWASSFEGDRYIVVTSFQGAQRFIYLFDSLAPTTAPVSYALDQTSSAVLVPHYDVDTRTLFLTGKGDMTIFAFEVDVAGECPPPERLKPLVNFDLPTPHQAVTFKSKLLCNVRKLEFACGYRLTTNAIEPFSFTIPRAHVSFFLFAPRLLLFEIQTNPIVVISSPNTFTMTFSRPPSTTARDMSSGPTGGTCRGWTCLLSSARTCAPRTCSRTAA